MRIPVKDHESLVRGENGVIHNKNKDEFDAYIKNRNDKLTQQQKIENLEIAFVEMKDTLDLIVSLLNKEKV